MKRVRLEDIEADTFASFVYERSGAESYHQILDIFKLFGFKNPRRGAYVVSGNVARFHDTQRGIVGTFVPKVSSFVQSIGTSVGLYQRAKDPGFEDSFQTDDVLNPLVRIPLLKGVFEINAGVSGAQDGAEQHVKFLKESLKEQGVLLRRSDPEKVGVIPIPGEEDLHVIRDRRAVGIPVGHGNGKNGLIIPREAVLQPLVFGELQEIFDHAVQSNRNEVATRALSECERSAADPNGILIAYWQDKERQHTWSMHEIAVAAERLSRQKTLAW